MYNSRVRGERQRGPRRKHHQSLNLHGK